MEYCREQRASFGLPVERPCRGVPGLLHPRGGPQGCLRPRDRGHAGWGCSWGVQRFGCADTKAIALLMHFSSASGKP